MAIPAMQWKCLCGEWVEGRYFQHSHAYSPEGYNPLTRRTEPLALPPKIWVYDRTPTDETRRGVNSAFNAAEV
jgi:hypothetical protein